MSTPAPCTYFAAGKCRNGDGCKFSHAAAAQSKPKPRLPCKFFLQNACKNGRDCQFSHDVDPVAIRTTSAGERKPAPGSFGTRCKFYDNGSCTTGAACPYRHVDGQNSSEHGSGSGSGKARKPATTVRMDVLARKKSDARAETTQAEGEATQQQNAWAAPPAEATGDNEGEEGQGVARLSDFLTKEEELYYYGAPGEFDLASTADNNDGKPSYADVAGKNVPEEVLEALQLTVEGTGAPPRPCTFFMQGNCRYGDSCFYSHSLERAPESDEEQELVRKEVLDSAELECGICFDLILIKGERFGLLSGCSHPFCLPCVRNWRGNPDQPKQTVRVCPVCRVETHFVIPSARMITDPARKKKLMLEYTRNLANIPCRHFDEGRGECPFGTSCFYAHRYATGEEASREVRTAVDAEGQYDVLRSVRLNHFFENLTMN